MKRYTGSTEGKRSPADHKMNLSESRLTSEVDTEKVAAEWLMQEGWLPPPTACSSCGGKYLTELLFAADRLPHWRCLMHGCGDRLSVFGASIFNGLRCPLAGLQKMLHVYCRLFLTVRPAVADMVQLSNLGRSAEGHHLCLKAKLQGRVEVDGTFVSSYPVSKDSPHHRKEIQELQVKRSRKGLEPCKAYKAHIMCLGAQTRGHFPILHVCPPVITPLQRCLTFENVFPQNNHISYLNRHFMNMRSMCGTYRSPLWLCAAYEGSPVLVHRQRATKVIFHKAVQERRLLVLPGIHYFDAHRLQPELLAALEAGDGPRNQIGEWSRWSSRHGSGQLLR